jgi:nucleotide-binding universal stress UspA family protein
VAEGTGCETVLLATPTGQVERLLLPVGAGTDTTRIAGFVAALLGDRAIDVTVYAVGPSDERSTADAVVDALRESGLPAGAVHTELPDAAPSTEAIVTAATDHDVVVMAQDTSLRGLLFGELPEQVAAHSLGPVFVVRRQEDDTTEP